jgi:hypothetical protein
MGKKTRRREKSEGGNKGTEQARAVERAECAKGCQRGRQKGEEGQTGKTASPNISHLQSRVLLSTASRLPPTADHFACSNLRCNDWLVDTSITSWTFATNANVTRTEKTVSGRKVNTVTIPKMVL